MTTAKVTTTLPNLAQEAREGIAKKDYSAAQLFVKVATELTSENEEVHELTQELTQALSAAEDSFSAILELTAQLSENSAIDSKVSAKITKAISTAQSEIAKAKLPESEEIYGLDEIQTIASLVQCLSEGGWGNPEHYLDGVRDDLCELLLDAEQSMENLIVELPQLTSSAK
jgi:uncharacterized protein HemY